MNNNQHWADPIQKPEEKTHPVMLVYVWLLCIAAAGVIVWEAVK